MRYIILTLIIIGNTFASNEDYELKLYERVIGSIFTSTAMPIYSDDNLKKTLQKSNKFVIVTNCDNAILIIGKEFKKKCTQLPWFATSFKIFKNEKNVIGAFYWRKGRPQLKLKSSELKKFNLPLPKSLQKYAQ